MAYEHIKCKLYNSDKFNNFREHQGEVTKYPFNLSVVKILELSYSPVCVGEHQQSNVTYTDRQ